MLYSIASTQPIMGPFGGVVYFSIPALVSLMDIYDVRDRRDCLDKVMYIWSLMHPGKETTSVSRNVGLTKKIVAADGNKQQLK